MRTPPARDVNGGAGERPPTRRPASEPARDGEALVEHLVERVARSEQSLRTTQGLVAQADRERTLLARAARTLASHDGDALVALVRLALPSLGDWCVIELHLGGTLERSIVAADRELESRCAVLQLIAPRASTSTLALAYVEQHAHIEATASLPVPDSLDAATQGAVQALGTGEVLLVPVLAFGDLGGVLAFGRGSDASAYDARDQRLAGELAIFAGLALEQRRIAAAADDASRAKTEFLTMMSHELRTPLNAIAGYAQLLEMGFRGPLTDGQREAVERILRGQEHLLELVDAVLTFSRLTSGRLVLDTLDLHAGTLLAAASDPVQRDFRERGIAFEVVACDASILVRADHERAPQIVRHLLSNALKFTEPGGRVTLACECDDELVRFVVSDTGRGIASAQRDAIFQPFVQAEKGHTRSVDGTGLGLAIARELAERMGGTLTVTSELGVGSRFVLALRRAVPRAEEVGVPA